MPMFDRVQQDEVRRLIRAILQDYKFPYANLIGSAPTQIDGGFAYSRSAVATIDVLDGGATATDTGEYTIDGGNA